MARWDCGGNATIRGAVAQYSRFVTPPTWVTYFLTLLSAFCLRGSSAFLRQKVPGFMARNLSDRSPNLDPFV